MTALMTEKPPLLNCQNCPVSYLKPEGDLSMSDGDAARAVGWTVWEGTTIGGRQEKRVFCPRCAGRTEDPDGLDEPRWDAVCDTCDARASEDDEYEDGPFTEEDARSWKDDHECEPWVRLVSPKQQGPS